MGITADDTSNCMKQMSEAYSRKDVIAAQLRAGYYSCYTPPPRFSGVVRPFGSTTARITSIPAAAVLFDSSSSQLLLLHHQMPIPAVCTGAAAAADGDDTKSCHRAAAAAPATALVTANKRRRITVLY